MPPTEIENEQQPATSNTQMIKKQQSVEVSSSKQAEDKDMDIKEKHKEIKAKNEEIKNEIYSQYLKQTTWIQNRLLLAFDYKNKNFLMSVLQLTVQTPKTTTDYKKVDFEVPVQGIHPLDQIEFHKKSS